MSAPRFYIGADGARVGSSGTDMPMPDGVAHHMLRVLRLAPGAALTLFDGSGGEWAATLTYADKRGAVARVGAFDPVERELPLQVTLALAVIASDAMDNAVRKAVELGASTIAPLTCARTQGVLRGAKALQRLAHWQQVAVAACEQCARNRVPRIVPVASFADWCATQDGSVALLAPGAPRTLAAWIRAQERSAAISVAVGPEGGYSEAELALSAQHGIARVGLGARVLRADTAALAALATLAALVGDAA